MVHCGSLGARTTSATPTTKGLRGHLGRNQMYYRRCSSEYSENISLSHTHPLEWPELPPTLSDTSVEDHGSEECDSRLAILERDFPRLQEEFLQTKAHGKLVHVAGETSAKVNSKAVT